MLRIPTARHIDHGTTRWYGWFRSMLPEANADIFCTKSWGVAEGRNHMVRDFLASDCEWLWMVDSDTVPPFSLHILEGCAKYPILAGPYRGFVDGQIIWHVYQYRRWDAPNRKHIWGAINERSWPKGRYFSVDGVGAGCLLIRRDLLEAQTDPWFELDRYPDGTVGTEDLRWCREIRFVNHGAEPPWVPVVDMHYVCRHYRDADLEALQRHMDDLCQKQKSPKR
jgi:hypothetical protein